MIAQCGARVNCKTPAFWNSCAAIRSFKGNLCERRVFRAGWQENTAHQADPLDGNGGRGIELHGEERVGSLPSVGARGAIADSCDGNVRTELTRITLESAPCQGVVDPSPRVLQGRKAIMQSNPEDAGIPNVGISPDAAQRERERSNRPRGLTDGGDQRLDSRSVHVPEESDREVHVFGLHRSDAIDSPTNRLIDQTCKGSSDLRREADGQECSNFIAHEIPTEPAIGVPQGGANLQATIERSSAGGAVGFGRAEFALLSDMTYPRACILLAALEGRCPKR